MKGLYRGIKEQWRLGAGHIGEKGEGLETPSRFRILTIDELREQGLLPELIKSYQKVFGGGDIWKEGAYCSREGWDSVISLEEFEKKGKDQGGFRCKCGGLFQPCYPYEIMEARITEELHEKDRSILVVIEGKSKNEIAGFLWGKAADFDEIEQSVIDTRYSWRRDQGVMEMNKLRKALRDKGLLEGQFLYGDEMGVLKEFRGGAKAFVSMIRLWLEFGHKKHLQKALFWTSEKSPLFNIALAFGCEVVHVTRDGTSFFVSQDFMPVLSALQNLSEEDIRGILVKSNRLIKNRPQ